MILVKRSLLEILQAKKAELALAQEKIKIDSIEEIQENLLPMEESKIIIPATKETFSLNIKLNDKQILAKELAFQGKSFCLTGAAGTGKTTAQREIARSLLDQNLLSTHDFRVQGTRDRWTGPSVAFCAYTRIASGNLMRAIHKDPLLEETFLYNVTTIHNLLEYSPETYWCYEENKEKFRFVPRSP